MNHKRCFEVLEHIKKTPAAWSQRLWHLGDTTEASTDRNYCGTSHCFAGHADLLFNGYDAVSRANACVLGRNAGVSWHAMQALDLERWQGCYLFHPERTLEEIEEFIVEDLARK